MVAVIVGGAAPAHAASYPTVPFDIPYGQSYARGTLTFYNRNVGIVGTVRITEGNCRGVSGFAFDSRGLPMGRAEYITYYCVASGAPSETHSFSGAIPADQPGGATSVDVCLVGRWLGQTNDTLLTCHNYPRP
jgi:hypothetical protein